MVDWEKNNKDGQESEFRALTREEKQKEHNDKSKALVKLIGENLAAYICALLPALLIITIWTDTGLAMDISSFIVDALISVILFIVAEYCMSQIGVKGGKLDDDYNVFHKEYLTLRKKVIECGISLMDIFCDWQIDVEYEFYIRRQCRKMKLDYKQYINEYSELDLKGLQEIFSPTKAAKIYALNQTKYIDLTPDILLTDGRVRSERGGVPVSGEEYAEKNTVGTKHVIMTVVFAILTALPTFTPTEDVTFGRVVFTLFKLCMLFFRMYSGYSRGAKAFHSVEVKHIMAKLKYLNLYMEFLDKKIYTRLSEKYGDADSVWDEVDMAIMLGENAKNIRSQNVVENS